MAQGRRARARRCTKQTLANMYFKGLGVAQDDIMAVRGSAGPPSKAMRTRRTASDPVRRDPAWPTMTLWRCSGSARQRSGPRRRREHSRDLPCARARHPRMMPWRLNGSARQRSVAMLMLRTAWIHGQQGRGLAEGPGPRLAMVPQSRRTGPCPGAIFCWRDVRERRGRGQRQIEQAVVWFRKAAEQGHMERGISCKPLCSRGLHMACSSP